jgi:hypothetical protein
MIKLNDYFHNLHIFFIYWYFARWIIIRFDVDWTSSFISINLVDVIISLTIKTLFDFVIINEQLTWYLRILVQKIIFYQTINLLNAVDFHNQRWQFFSSLMTFFDQIIFAIRKFECKILLCFSIRRIIFCWLIIYTSITRIL